MWPILDEFRSASSEIRGRKKERKKEESVVKYKSADIYVGRPITTRKSGNYSDVLPLKAVRHDSISNLTSFQSELQTNPMPLHLESLCWGATLLPHRGCAMDWSVDKNSGPVLSRLWTKVHEIFGHRRRPFVLSNALVRLSTSPFVQQIFAIMSRSRRKPNKCKSFLTPNVFGIDDATFLRQIVSTTYRPPFGKVWLCSVCRSRSAKTAGNKVECRFYGGWVNTHFQFEAVC